jgi:hypothetical protein
VVNIQPETPDQFSRGTDNREGMAEHAAVTIGGGYVLNKPSQAWFSPRVVWTVQETIAASRYRGVTLSRYFMAAQT